MTILQRLTTLLQKEHQLFIREVYREFLNRSPRISELNHDSQLLSLGSSRLNIIEKVVLNKEALNLYGQSLISINRFNCTIADIIRTFFKKDIYNFVKSCYKEIVGLQQMAINVQKHQFLAEEQQRLQFIMTLIKRKHLLKDHVHRPEAQGVSQRNYQYYYTTAWQWIQESKLFDHFISLKQEEMFKGNPPKSIDSSIVFDHGDRYVSQPYVMMIPEGRYSGAHHGAVLTPDGRIVKDLSHEMFEKFNMQYSGSPYPFTTSFSGSIAVLHSYFSYNYFHWLFDVASRLDYIRNSNFSVDKYIVDSRDPFQEEVLFLLNIPKERRIQVHDKLHIKSNKLIVPSYTGCINSIVPKRSCEFLREELLLKRNVKTKKSTRIYISRADANGRFVSNEEQVMKLLGSYGFTRVVLKPLSVNEKIELFQSAEVIIAPHGAGLTNLIFCNPGTKVIELFNANWMLPCYWMICQHIGLDYYYLVGKGERLAPRFNLGNIFDDILVDLNQLARTLELASIS